VYHTRRYSPHTPMRTNIDLDDALVEEAFRLTEVRTKKELLHLALQEFIRGRKKKNLLELAGKIQFDENYDHKALRTIRHAAD
jgi:Arc/MetJ family transcription regulator